MNRKKLATEDTLFLQALRSACWGTLFPKCTIEQENYIYKEFKNHAIEGMALPILNEIRENDYDLFYTWQNDICRVISRFYQVRYIQDRVLEVLVGNGITAVILKGIAAAKYYPKPECRILGDIDIMVKGEDYSVTCEKLVEFGCAEKKYAYAFDRHRNFNYLNVEIEVHRRFASLNNIEQAKIMDGYIMNTSVYDGYLPDHVNGLVILEHISQHMEGGIGLRQILDWMFFVDKWLDDIHWNSIFRRMAESVGMDTLAITVTRMCQKYLGLKQGIAWCVDANEILCDDLMKYILESGNFGGKQAQERQKTIVKITSFRNLFSLIKHMQRVGVEEWDAIKKYHFLRPYAWIWKSIQLIKRVIRGNVGFDVIIESRKRIKLFQELGVKQNYKGIAKYIGEKMYISKD